ncbi:hypothetical protein BDW72DRAFT_180857 [Aspergillus terricola var. indicus]
MTLLFSSNLINPEHTSMIRSISGVLSASIVFVVVVIARACCSPSTVRSFLVQTVHIKARLARFLRFSVWPWTRTKESSYTRSYASEPVGRFSNALLTSPLLILSPKESKCSFARRNIPSTAWTIVSFMLNLNSWSFDTKGRALSSCASI